MHNWRNTTSIPSKITSLCLKDGQEFGPALFLSVA